MKKGKILLKEEKGQALIIVAILFSVLIAFGALAVEYSYLSLQQRKLQNAADAGALGGIIELAEGNKKKASNVARDLVEANLEHINKNKIVVDVIDIDSDFNKIKVIVTYKFDGFFIKWKNHPFATATAAWYEEVVGEVSAGNTLSQTILPVAIMNSDDEKAQLIFDNYGNDIKNNKGLVGFATTINGPLHTTTFRGFFGYFNEIPVGNIKPFNIFSSTYFTEFKNSEIKSLFEKNSKIPEDLKKLDILFKNRVATVPNSYSETIEKAVENRIKKIKDKNLDFDDEMTALIPIVKHYTGDSSSYIRRYNNGWEIPSNFVVSSYGTAHYELEVIGYRKIVVRDIVNKIDGKNIEGKFADEDWKVKDFKSFIGRDLKDNDKDNKTYGNSIIVSFGERYNNLDNVSITEKKIVYRLIK